MQSTFIRREELKGVVNVQRVLSLLGERAPVAQRERLLNDVRGRVRQSHRPDAFHLERHRLEEQRLEVLRLLGADAEHVDRRSRRVPLCDVGHDELEFGVPQHVVGARRAIVALEAGGEARALDGLVESDGAPMSFRPRGDVDVGGEDGLPVERSCEGVKPKQSRCLTASDDELLLCTTVRRAAGERRLALRP